MNFHIVPPYQTNKPKFSLDGYARGYETPAKVVPKPPGCGARRRWQKKERSKGTVQPSDRSQGVITPNNQKTCLAKGLYIKMNIKTSGKTQKHLSKYYLILWETFSLKLPIIYGRGKRQLELSFKYVKRLDEQGRVHVIRGIEFEAVEDVISDLLKELSRTVRMIGYDGESEAITLYLYGRIDNYLRYPSCLPERGIVDLSLLLHAKELRAELKALKSYAETLDKLPIIDTLAYISPRHNLEETLEKRRLSLSDTLRNITGGNIIGLTIISENELKQARKTNPAFVTDVCFSAKNTPVDNLLKLNLERLLAPYFVFQEVETSSIEERLKGSLISIVKPYLREITPRQGFPRNWHNRTKIALSKRGFITHYRNYEIGYTDSHIWSKVEGARNNFKWILSTNIKNYKARETEIYNLFKELKKRR